MSIVTFSGDQPTFVIRPSAGRRARPCRTRCWRRSRADQIGERAEAARRRRFSVRRRTCVAPSCRAASRARSAPADDERVRAGSRHPRAQQANRSGPRTTTASPAEPSSSRASRSRRRRGPAGTQCRRAASQECDADIARARARGRLSRRHLLPNPVRRTQLIAGPPRTRHFVANARCGFGTTRSLAEAVRSCPRARPCRKTRGRAPPARSPAMSVPRPVHIRSADGHGAYFWSRTSSSSKSGVGMSRSSTASGASA